MKALSNHLPGVLWLLLILNIVLFSSPLMGQERTLKVGIYQNPPKVFWEKNDPPKGFWIDLLKSMAREKNWELYYVPGTWSECLDKLNNYQIDMMIDVAYSHERTHFFDFNDKTILVDWGIIYSREWQDINDLNDLEGKKIAVVSGDLSYITFQQLEIDCQYIECNSYTEVLNNLDSGKADAGILSRHFAKLNENNFPIVSTGIIVSPLSIRFAFPKDYDHSLIAEIDQYVSDLKSNKNSIYYTLLNKWLLTGKDQIISTTLKIGLIIAVPTIILLTFLIIILYKRIKTAIDQLINTKELYASTLDNLIEGCMIINKEWKYAYLNKSAIRQFHLEDTDLIGHHIISSNPQIENSEIFEQFKICMSESESHLMEYNFQYSDGSTNWFEIYIQPVPEGLFILSMDINDRKEALHSKLLRENAERANQAKSVFLSQMSHEIRTPLNAIMGYIQLMQKDKSLGKKQQGYLNTIQKSSEHLLGLINDILDLSKVEAGHISLNPTAFSLKNFMETLKLMFLSRTRAKGLNFIMELDDELPDFIIADNNKLRQIFINLLGNSVKFTEDGGIVVRMKSESDKIDENSIRLITQVEDTGQGISEEDQKEIFQPFEQAGMKQNGEGTGLGLTIAKELVSLMGGCLTVTSELDKGTVFTFDILVQPSSSLEIIENVPISQVIGYKSELETIRILSVDDNQNNLDILDAFLVPIGFEVKQALNGKMAVEIFEQWLPHVVFMDMRMPVMDGYVATQLIKETEKGKETPVIALTASAFENAEKKAKNAGADGYIRKPFREDELFNTLKELLPIDYVYQEVDIKGDVSENNIMISKLKDFAKALPDELVLNIVDALTIGDLGLMTKYFNEDIAEINQDISDELNSIANQFEYELLMSVFNGEHQNE